MIYRQLIEDSLKSLLVASPLFDSASYSLLQGGKRLRPHLLLLTAQTYGASLEHALHPACALEMIHTYSLIHDDLPCMDNDDFRRGKPSLHKAYPEGHALLTGDYLLTYAFEILSNAPLLSDRQKILLIQILSTRAGADGMIGGQAIDLSSATLDWEGLTTMHLKKTGALITAAFEMGAVIGNLSPSHLSEVGQNLGLAFQILDDLTDADDLEKNRRSALALLGPKEARTIAQNLIEKALSSLSPSPLRTYILEQFG